MMQQQHYARRAPLKVRALPLEDRAEVDNIIGQPVLPGRWAAPFLASEAGGETGVKGTPIWLMCKDLAPEIVLYQREGSQVTGAPR